MLYVSVPFPFAFIRIHYPPRMNQQPRKQYVAAVRTAVIKLGTQVLSDRNGPDAAFLASCRVKICTQGHLPFAAGAVVTMTMAHARRGKFGPPPCPSSGQMRARIAPIAPPMATVSPAMENHGSSFWTRS